MKKIAIAPLFLTVALVAPSAFAWPWSSKKDDANAQQMVQDSLKREEFKKLQNELNGKMKKILNGIYQKDVYIY